MPVDYAVPSTIQERKIDIAVPATTGAIVPYKVPTATPATPAPAPQISPPVVIRDLPTPLEPLGDVRPKPNPNPVTPLQRGVNTLRTSDQIPTPTNPLIHPSNGVSYGRYPAGVTDADVEGTAALGKMLVGVYDQLSGANPVGATNTRRENQRQVFTPLENLGYEIGRRAAQGGQQTVSNTVNTIDNLWRNRPQFEIPEIKIPEIKLPQIPEIKLPKIPEFDLPELPKIKLPQIKPQPKPRTNPPPRNKEEELRELKPGACGIIDFRFSYQFLVTATGRLDENGFMITSRIPISLEEFLKLRREDSSDDENYTDKQLIENGEDTVGSFRDSSLNYYAEYYRGNRIEPVPNSYPYYRQNAVRVIAYDGSNVAKILDQFKVSYPFIVYDYVVQYPGNGGCSIVKPKPTPPPEPCCMCCNGNENIDYARIKRIMQDTLKEQKYSIDVPICKCEYNQQKGEWEPKITNTTLDFFATSEEQAKQQARLHFENAAQLSEMCVARNKEEAVVSLPLSWPIRNEGSRPQIVLHCGERYKNSEGKIDYKSAMYPITVPHWKGGPNDKPSLPTYRKGNWEGIYVLKDNSKVTINAANEAECLKILNAIKPWIKKEMHEGAYFKGGKINVEIKSTIVKPMYGRYFSQGQKKSKPDWRVDFP